MTSSRTGDASRPVRPPVAGAVITVSDRCAAGETEDRSGPLAVQLLAQAGVRADVVVVPDGVHSVQQAVTAVVGGGARFVLTTGGTGVGPRDLTPEATAPLLERTLPGVAELLRAQGAASVPTAVLSRGLAGTTAAGPDSAAAFVVNVPGSPAAVRDAVAVLAPLIHHVVDQLGGGTH